MTSSSRADSTVAIPWFNNIWLNDDTLTDEKQASSSLNSSSRQTVSTLSAVDRISVCSLQSTNTHDFVHSLSDSKSANELKTDANVQMRLLTITSSDIKQRSVSTPVTPRRNSVHDITHRCIQKGTTTS